MMTVYIIVSIVSLFLVVWLYGFLKSKGSKKRILESFQQLAATMGIEGARIQSLPSLALAGVYRSLNITIECSIKKIDHTKLYAWQVLIPLEGKKNERYYIQSESLEGKLRKVVDLDLVTTNDHAFDSQVLIFASDEAKANRIFNPYLRGRFLAAGYRSFTLSIAERMATLDLYLPMDASVSIVRHHIEALAEFVNIIEVV